MVSKVIVDSSVWVSLYNESDQNHKKSLALINDIKLTKEIPHSVFEETLTVLKMKVSLEVAKQFTDFVLNNNQLEIKSFIDRHDSFLKTFLQEDNKKLSFVDSTLLALSSDYKIITHDKDLQKKIYEK